jgi:hypothetical protein
MPFSKSQARLRVHRTTAIASLAIAGLTYQQAANAAPGEGDPATAAFGNAASFTIPAGSLTFSAPLAQVPIGKRYVIELVSLACSTPQGEFISSAVLNVGQKVPSGANSFSTQAFSISLQSQGNEQGGAVDQGGMEHFVGTLAARVYADDITGSPSDVLLNVTRSTTYSATNCVVSFSGYLLSLHSERSD